MAINKARIIVRRAKEEDYDAIMKIGDVFGGKDYLPSKYFSFMKDPDIYPLVAEVDGTPVAFNMAQFLDGGKTVNKRSGRVHKSYRGGGIFRVLSEELDRYIKNERPNVEFGIFGTSDVVGRGSSKYLEKGYVEIYRKHSVNMVFKVADLKGEDNSEEFSHVQKMTELDLKRLFLNDEMVNRLFPKKRIFNCFIGYRIMEENIKHFLNDSTEVYATSSHYCRGNENQGDFESQNICLIDILSFSHHYSVEQGLFYEINIYAISEVDYKNLEAHVKKHVSLIRRLCSSKVILMFMFDVHVIEEKVLKILGSFGITKVLPFEENYSVLYERSLKQN